MSKAAVKDAFRIQAEACLALGSTFTASLCQSFHDNLTDQTAVGEFCLGWVGDPGPSADSIPLRLCGGFHAIVLSGLDEALKEHYPPDQTVAPQWLELERVLVAHEAFLLGWLTSPPQTNEVSRSGVLWPAMMEISRRTKLPLSLLEVGASAGLNLNLDKFQYTLGNLNAGQANASVHLSPEWKGNSVQQCEVSITARRGCDINPLNPQEERDALRLRSYVWPDQLDRKQRLDNAIEIACTHPVKVDHEDALSWLERHLSQRRDNVCTVVYSTIAWQYLPPAAREEGEKIILGHAASNIAPLAWLRFEPDGESPGAGIKLQIWPSGEQLDLGRGDFHGRWIDWRG